jgi:hypothetical protein
MNNADRFALTFIIGLVGLAVVEKWDSFLIGWTLSSGAIFFVHAVVTLIAKPENSQSSPE